MNQSVPWRKEGANREDVTLQVRSKGLARHGAILNKVFRVGLSEKMMLRQNLLVVRGLVMKLLGRMRFQAEKQPVTMSWGGACLVSSAGWSQVKGRREPGQGLEGRVQEQAYIGFYSE